MNYLKVLALFAFVGILTSCDFGAADEWPTGVVVTDSSEVIGDSLLVSGD